MLYTTHGMYYLFSRIFWAGCAVCIVVFCCVVGVVDRLIMGYVLCGSVEMMIIYVILWRMKKDESLLNNILLLLLYVNAKLNKTEKKYYKL